mmetsp:Transcript_18032/g.35391  ORF Transcript_18032/g.35391 Transcript_18032/m.35391 type:complete len:262 (+) Transcript_18032:469-1254(+)
MSLPQFFVEFLDNFIAGRKPPFLLLPAFLLFFHPQLDFVDFPLLVAVVYQDCFTSLNCAFVERLLFHKLCLFELVTLSLSPELLPHLCKLLYCTIPRAAATLVFLDVQPEHCRKHLCIRVEAVHFLASCVNLFIHPIQLWDVLVHHLVVLLTQFHLLAAHSVEFKLHLIDIYVKLVDPLVAFPIFLYFLFAACLEVFELSFHRIVLKRLPHLRFVFHCCKPIEPRRNLVPELICAHDLGGVVLIRHVDMLPELCMPDGFVQ